MTDMTDMTYMTEMTYMADMTDTAFEVLLNFLYRTQKLQDL